MSDESKLDTVSPAAVTHTQTGKTTFYYAAGKVGNAEVILDEWSAAHQTLPFWQVVHVYDLNNSTKTANVWVLDRGGFSYPIILDIDHKRFVTDFYPESVGWFDSKITWYTNN